MLNFKTPPPHSPRTFRMDVINVWSHIGKDLKKEGEWESADFNGSIFYLFLEHIILIRLTKSNIRDKNNGENMLYDRGDVF